MTLSNASWDSKNIQKLLASFSEELRVLHLQIYFYFEVSARNYNDRSSGVTNSKSQLKICQCIWEVMSMGYHSNIALEPKIEKLIHFDEQDRITRVEGRLAFSIFVPLFKCRFKSLSVMLPSI